MNLLRLAELTGKEAYRRQAERAFAAFAHDVTRAPGGHPKLLSALDHYLDRPLEVLIVSPDASANAEPLVARFRRAYLPNRIFTLTTEGQALERLERLVPALEDKRALRGRVTACVCERGRCELPTSDPQVFARQLAKIRPLPRVPSSADDRPGYLPSMLGVSTETSIALQEQNSCGGRRLVRWRR